MKKYSVIFAAVIMVAAVSCAWADVAVSPENFPNEVFRSYIAENFDTNGGGILSDSEIAAAEKISVADRDINSLEGIRNFTSLSELNCEGNSITSLNITGCNNLEHLSARENAITGTVDLHGITTLKSVNVRTNHITSLDVHGCTALTDIYARDNQLRELNITGCNVLENLSCGTDESSGPEHTNRIKTLDLSGKTKLKEL